LGAWRPKGAFPPENRVGVTGHMGDAPTAAMAYCSWALCRPDYAGTPKPKTTGNAYD